MRPLKFYPLAPIGWILVGVYGGTKWSLLGWLMLAVEVTSEALRISTWFDWRRIERELDRKWAEELRRFSEEWRGRRKRGAA